MVIFIILGIAAYLGVGLIVTGAGSLIFEPIACSEGVHFAFWSVFWPAYLLAFMFLAVCGIIVVSFMGAGRALDSYAKWIRKNHKFLIKESNDRIYY